MYGTEKQIKYAEDIISEAYIHVDSIIKHYQDENEGCLEKWVQMNNDVIFASMHVREWLDDCVNRADDAYKWIEGKDMFSVPNLNRKINKLIQYYCNKRGGMEMIELDIYYKPEK